MKTINIVSVLETQDQTYEINKDQDVTISFTPPPEPVESVTLPDGSVISGSDLVKQCPPTNTTLENIKNEISCYQNKIDDCGRAIDEANVLIDDYQEKITELEKDLAEADAIVEEAIKDWKPLPPDPVEEPIEELIEEPLVETLP
jgi:hypothetical protein